jgi:hypothetical protein
MVTVAVKMIVTDEMVEKAAKAMNNSEGLIWTNFRVLARAALEEVVPALIAAELRRWSEPAFDVVSTKMLRDRAQELDPQ